MKIIFKTIFDCRFGFPTPKILLCNHDAPLPPLILAFLPEKRPKCSIRALFWRIFNTKFSQSPFLTAESDSPPQNVMESTWKAYYYLLQWLCYPKNTKNAYVTAKMKIRVTPLAQNVTVLPGNKQNMHFFCHKQSAKTPMMLLQLFTGHFDQDGL